MSFRHIAVLSALGVSALSGCSTQVKVSYHTTPPGATLYESGKPRGLTPLYLLYATDDAYKKGGCMRLKEIKVEWLSGAESTEDAPLVCAGDGYSKVVEINRPGLPGREIDESYARSLKQNHRFKLRQDYAVRNQSPANMRPSGTIEGEQAGQECSRRSRAPPYFGECRSRPDRRP